jgi:UDP-N-acetylmuramoyl-L-alanyl-D-glutamate--2,6-diaminopimelate ligase
MHQLSSPHRRIRLGDLPTRIQGDGIDRFEFQSCSSDWRLCQPNDLYVAIDQAHGDGHDHVEQAIKAGAQAILAERLLPVEVPVFLTPDTREAFGHICHQLCDFPTHALQAIGVAGTSGKSTVAGMLHAILKAAGRDSLLATDAHWQRFSDSETPQPLSSPQVSVGLSDAVALGKQFTILEMHSEQLARRTWSGVQLDVGILTGLRADFQDHHGSMENYIRATERILDHLKETGLAIVNADDSKLRSLLDRLAYPALTYGIQNEAEIMGEILEESPTDQTVLIQAGCEAAPVRLARPGQHFLSNALAATAAALALGIDLLDIQRGLETYEPADATLELLPQQRTPAEVHIDQAIYPDRLRAALSSLYRQKTGRLWCVLEVSSKLSDKHRSSMGALLERYTKNSVIAVAPELAESGFEAIHDVMDGYEKVGRDMVIPQLGSALDWILSQAQSGDTILIAAGQDSYATAIEELNKADVTPEITEEVNTPIILRIDDYRYDS